MEGPHKPYPSMNSKLLCVAASQPFGGVFRYPGSINLNRLDDVFQVVNGMD